MRLTKGKLKARPMPNYSAHRNHTHYESDLQLEVGQKGLVLVDFILVGMDMEELTEDFWNHPRCFSLWICPHLRSRWRDKRFDFFTT
mmetsp:Transcript_19106/g.26266  ORF Transcript_19106/g.26266 Transcript_19106/m.26266 type:complete len:87 (-) Transcript_19106:433-693(-)